MTDGNKGGRPTSYTPAQLEDALTRAEAESEAPSLSDIKRHLQAVTGHKRAPNDASLQRNIDEVRAARQRRKEDALIDALPEATRTKVTATREVLERSALLAVAEALDAEKSRLAEREHARDREKDALAFQLRAVEEERERLQSELEDTRAELATAQADRDAAHQRLSEARAVDVALQKLMKRVESLEGDVAAATDDAVKRSGDA